MNYKIKSNVIFLIITLFIPYKIFSSDLNIKKHDKFTDLDFECVIQSGPNMYMGCEDNYVYYSYNFGKNWQKIKLRRGGGNVDDIIEISNGILLATGGMYDDSYICKSTDYGRSWERVWFDDGIELTTLLKLKNGTVLGFGEDDEYVKSLNLEYNKWEEIDRDWGVADFDDEEIWDAELINNNKIILVGDEGLFFCFDTTLDTIYLKNEYENEKLDITTISKGVGEILIQGTDDGAIYFSEDNGKKWIKTFQDTAYNSLINGIAFNGAGLGYAVGHNGLIAKSQDFGKTWTVCQVGGIEAYNDILLLHNSSFLVVGDDGLIITILSK